MCNNPEYIKETFKPIPWRKKEEDNCYFENVIYSTLQNELAAQRISINRTSENNQFIIETSKDFFALNHQFINNNKDRPVFIDCIYSENGDISYKPHCSLLQSISYYVLVTNSSISPQHYFEIQHSAKINNCIFILVDQIFLYSYLKKQNVNLKKFYPLDTSVINHDPIRVQVETKVISHPKTKVISYLLVKNYDNKHVSIKITMPYDDQYFKFNNKRTVETECTLKPNEVHAFSLSIESTEQIAESTVFLIVNCKDAETKVQKKLEVKIDFPKVIEKFRSKAHDDIAKDLIEKLNDSTCGILYLFGVAGIGKSTIIKDICPPSSKHPLKDIAPIHYNIPLKNENYDEFVQNIKNDIEADFCPENKQWAKDAKKFTEIIYECKNLTETSKKPVIILDDFHNITDSFLEEIKKLAGCKLKNVNIVLVGRDDFSAGSVNYYTFKEWCKDKDNLVGHTVTSLTDDETRQFVVSLLAQHNRSTVPPGMINRLCELSDNNPLFVTQYVQYWIERPEDERFFGENIRIRQEKFISEKLPEKIRALYCARFEHLTTILNKKQYDSLMTSLCAFATMGKSVDCTIFEEIIKDDKTIELLVNRHFLLKYAGKYHFVHETLLLYLKNYIIENRDNRVKIADVFLKNQNRLNLIKNPRELGKIFCWSKKYQKAAKYFKTDIEKIRGFTKFSSTNVDPEIYEYIEDIVEILSHKNDNVDVVNKALLQKIYISLHYHTPYKAIKDGEDAINKLCDTSDGGKEKTQNSIKVLQAHAYVNCAQFKKAELLYSELLCKFVNQADTFTSDALFDMWDRFASLHIAYNLFDLALEYIGRSETEKNKDIEKVNNPDYIALIMLTLGKLYFFSNPEKTVDYNKAIIALQDYDKISDRIKCHICLTDAITEAIVNNWENLDRTIEKVYAIRERAKSGSYTFSIVRVHNFLAVLHYLQESEKIKSAEERKKQESFGLTIMHAKNGINDCITYGLEGELYYFYNILALVHVKKGETDTAARYFDAMFNALRNQNLLSIGSDRLCYGNILALNNIAKYLAGTSVMKFKQNMKQLNMKGSLAGCDPKCKKFSDIDVLAKFDCEPSCINIDQDQLETWLKNVRKNKPIVTTQSIPAGFLDKDTGYYLIISIA